jgi:hypothetical protein
MDIALLVSRMAYLELEYDFLILLLGGPGNCRSVTRDSRQPIFSFEMRRDATRPSYVRSDLLVLLHH